MSSLFPPWEPTPTAMTSYTTLFHSLYVAMLALMFGSLPSRRAAGARDARRGRHVH